MLVDELSRDTAMTHVSASNGAAPSGSAHSGGHGAVGFSPLNRELSLAHMLGGQDSNGPLLAEAGYAHGANMFNAGAQPTPLLRACALA